MNSDRMTEIQVLSHLGLSDKYWDIAELEHWEYQLIMYVCVHKWNVQLGVHSYSQIQRLNSKEVPTIAHTLSGELGSDDLLCSLLLYIVLVIACRKHRSLLLLHKSGDWRSLASEECALLWPTTTNGGHRGMEESQQERAVNNTVAKYNPQMPSSNEYASLDCKAVLQNHVRVVVKVLSSFSFRLRLRWRGFPVICRFHPII